MSDGSQADAWSRAEEAVATSEELRHAFLKVLNQNGVVEQLAPDCWRLHVAGESDSRIYVIDATRLRRIFVEWSFQIMQTGELPFRETLPRPFEDDLRETIGSAWEPYQMRYVIVNDRGELVSSETPTPPASP